MMLKSKKRRTHKTDWLRTARLIEPKLGVAEAREFVRSIYRGMKPRPKRAAA